MKFIAEPLGILLTGIYNLIENYGITLIVFTLIVRICLLPLYANQIKHTARMGDMQPKMKAIQNKYAHDKELMNQKMSELYKEEKFNPMRGCLPMLIQFPIILGLFSLLRNPMVYLKSDAMMMAVHESFFWIPDLSQPDPWVLPLLAGITTFFSFTMSQAMNPTSANNPQTAPMMKIMKFFFPVMIVWMGRSFPAGLALYWFIGNLVQIAQTYFLNKWKSKLKKADEQARKKRK